MKAIVEEMNRKNIICKSLEEVSPKCLGSRKKVSLYVGVDLKSYYCMMIKIVKKSRILRKEAEEFMVLHEKMEAYKKTKITKKYIWIDAPLCSKAKALLEEHGWKVFHQVADSKE